jgi:hypothetical protein
MQYTIVTLATLFAAALGAPSDISPRQSVFTELAIYGDQGCANGRTGTDFITNQAGCQALSGNVVGAKVDIAIPAGCKSKAALKSCTFWLANNLHQSCFMVPATAGLDRPSNTH